MYRFGEGFIEKMGSLFLLDPRSIGGLGLDNLALTMMSTGTISGQIQAWLGYRDFFLFVLVASVPPVLFAWIAPFAHHEPADAGGA